MNNESFASSELISALVDGELTGDEFESSIALVTRSRGGLSTWHAYHMVGEVLRGQNALTPVSPEAFVARFRNQLEQENVHRTSALAQPVMVSRGDQSSQQDGANDAIWRWKLLAGAASLAAVATIGWHVAGAQPGAGAEVTMGVVPQVAAAIPISGGDGRAAVQEAQAVMLRDARLDELMAAHKQFGGTSALQKPAGFLRNATFDGPAR